MNYETCISYMKVKYFRIQELDALSMTYAIWLAILLYKFHLVLSRVS